MTEPTQTRHGLLSQLHELLRPEVYLEIGVQHGYSLSLAKPPTRAYGIDPHPLVSSGNMAAETHIYPITSDHFFATPDLYPDQPVNFAFIDGMHLFEYVLRDFIGVEALLASPDTVVVFDDVLPRNEQEAKRTQCPGDWTGDVWKIYQVLRQHRADLDMCLVDTFPTGTLVVWNLDPGNSVLSDRYDLITAPPAMSDEVPIPDHILNRLYAYPARQVMDRVEFWWTGRRRQRERSGS